MNEFWTLFFRHLSFETIKRYKKIQQQNYEERKRYIFGSFWFNKKKKTEDFVNQGFDEKNANGMAYFRRFSGSNFESLSQEKENEK